MNPATHKMEHGNWLRINTIGICGKKTGKIPTLLNGSNSYIAKTCAHSSHIFWFAKRISKSRSLCEISFYITYSTFQMLVKNYRLYQYKTIFMVNSLDFWSTHWKWSGNDYVVYYESFNNLFWWILHSILFESYLTLLALRRFFWFD